MAAPGYNRGQLRLATVGRGAYLVLEACLHELFFRVDELQVVSRGRDEAFADMIPSRRRISRSWEYGLDYAPRKFRGLEQSDLHPLPRKDRRSIAARWSTFPSDVLLTAYMLLRCLGRTSDDQNLGVLCEGDKIEFVATSRTIPWEGEHWPP